VLDRQGVATRHSGGYGEETQRSRSGYGAARMPRLLRDRALVLLGGSSSPGTSVAYDPPANGLIGNPGIENTGAACPDVENFQGGSGEVERLTYTITFLGVAVARAILDEVRPEGPGGEWIVRGASRTTAFWEQFTYIHNSYVTRFRSPGFQPSVYDRRIDQKGLRFRRIEWYGREGTDAADAGRLPPLPDRYRTRGAPVAADVMSVPSGQGNFFSVLWYLRYADWDRMLEVTLPLWLEGQRWQVTVKRAGVEWRRVPQGRVETWKLVCRLSRDTSAGGGQEQQTQAVPSTDHVTRHLMDEDAELIFWIERGPSRRPIAVGVSVGVFRVTGQLREPFEDERPPY